ncbi:MAG: FeoB small GTPase domain-containing protein, partial [Phycisphaerae bacterium]
MRHPKNEIDESATVPMHAMRDEAFVAVVGNPNTGKSTLFNALTGFRQRVGNYPGVTVEKKTGLLRGDTGGRRIELVDLPGAYSLAARSVDEAVVLDVLAGHQGRARLPDVIVVVVDAAHLARNLFFASQVLDIATPTVIALNMMDVAEASGLRIDSEAIGRGFGVQVVPVVATKLFGVDRLRNAIIAALGTPPAHRLPEFPECVQRELAVLARSVARLSGGATHASNVALLQALLDPGGYHETTLTEQCGVEFAADVAGCRERIRAAGESIVEVEARVRYRWISDILHTAVTRTGVQRVSRSELCDKILTHRVVGLLILLVLMGACFQSIYAWADPLMNGIDEGVAVFSGWVTSLLPAGALRSLLVDGAIS